jgi:hypothetical protein
MVLKYYLTIRLLRNTFRYHTAKNFLEKIKADRQTHMLSQKARGYPVTWIAKLYKKEFLENPRSFGLYLSEIKNKTGVDVLDLMHKHGIK